MRKGATPFARKARNLALFALLVAAAIVSKNMYDLYALAGLPHPPRSPASSDAAKRLESHVEELAGSIGRRNYKHARGLGLAENYIREGLKRDGYDLVEQKYDVTPPGATQSLQMTNFIATRPSMRPGAPVLVIGAHYDTALETPGADDNASGVAVLLELAHRLRRSNGDKDVQFVAYGTEEPPFFGTPQMGSSFHAQSLKTTGRVVAGMASLEMLGYYDDAKGSQKYPFPLAMFFPDKGDYIGVISDLKSRQFLKAFVREFTPSENLPVVSAALPGWIGEIRLSDQCNYWDRGFPAIMISDTAFLRYRDYHMPTDVPSNLDFNRMADVTDGLEAAVRNFANMAEAASVRANLPLERTAAQRKLK